MKQLAAALLVFLTAAAAAVAQDSVAVPRKPKTYVTDRPKVLSKETRQRLETKLANFGKDTGNQVVVWIGSTLPADVTLEEYANASFNLWGIGQKEKNNGVLLMIFVKSRKMRLETGNGVRDRLSDARAAEIIEEMKPALRVNNYDAAVSIATNSIVQALLKVPAPPPPPVQAVASTPATAPQVSNGAMASGCIMMVVIAALGLALLIAIFKGLRALGRRAVSGGTTFGASGPSVHHYHHRTGWGWGAPRTQNVTHYYPDTSRGSSNSSSDASSSSSSGSSSGGSSSSGSSGSSFSGGGSSSGGGASGSW
jgi:uncharacterized protein